MANRILIGPATKVRINGQDMGFVTGIQYQLSEPADEERGIDSPRPFEISSTVTQVSGSISVLMLREWEGLEGNNITPGLPFIPQGPYIQIQVVERPGDRIIFDARDCKIDGQSWSAQPKQMVAGTFTFKGIMAYTAFTNDRTGL